MPAPLGWDHRDRPGPIGAIARWHTARRVRRVRAALAERRVHTATVTADWPMEARTAPQVPESARRPPRGPESRSDVPRGPFVTGGHMLYRPTALPSQRPDPQPPRAD